MAEATPDISVIIPTYNRREYVQKAIESCFVENDGVSVEVIVVDDGSTDNTRNFLRSLHNPRVRAVFQEDQGASAARNHGMQKARGDFLKFLDDDDYLRPGTLISQYDALNESDADVCYGDYTVEFEGDKSSHLHTNQDHSSLFVGLASGDVNRIPLSFLFERSALEGVHWDEGLKYLEDVEFMMRAASQHRLTSVKINDPVGVHRIHEGERLSDYMKGDPVVPQLQLQCSIYWDAYNRLAEQGAVGEPIRSAAATGLWREAHKLAAFDIFSFKKWYDRVKEIDPSFKPPRTSSLLHYIDQISSPWVTEFLTYPIRKYQTRE